MTSTPASLEDLVAHLTRTTPLSASEVVRVLAEVVAHFSETPEDYVRRRHREMQGRGLRNEEIFQRTAAELTDRRFAAPEFSERQLRRIVYG